jgi:hypothetical protein
MMFVLAAEAVIAWSQKIQAGHQQTWLSPEKVNRKIAPLRGDDLSFPDF